MNEIDRQSLFSERFIEALAGVLQSEVADYLRCSRSLVNNWVHKRAFPNAYHLSEICEYLGVSADWLLGIDKTVGGIHEYNGIKWFAQVSKHLVGKHRQEVEDGIELFQLIVKERLTLDDIIRLPVNKFAHLNAPAFVRLVKSVLLMGAIQLVDVERDYDREQKLISKYKLKHCIVAKTDTLVSSSIIDDVVRVEAIAFLAARDCINYIAGSQHVGMTGGDPISRFVDLILPAHPDLRGLTWWSLLASKGQGTVAPPGTSANSVVSRMRYKQPSTHAFLMPFIDVDRRSKDYHDKAHPDEKEELDRARKTKQRAMGINVAILSVGCQETDYDRVDAQSGAPAIMDVLDSLTLSERNQCKGDVLLRLLDGQGQPIGGENTKKLNDAAVYSIELDDLNKIAEKGQVWVFAARYQKANVIRGLLLAGRVNCLVIDTTVAKML